MGLSSNGEDADRDGGIIAANFAGVWLTLVSRRLAGALHWRSVITPSFSTLALKHPDFTLLSQL
jgi:hypothetical protein